MLKVYEQLNELSKETDVEILKNGINKILKNIESGEYVVIDVPFGKVDFVNVLNDEDGDVIITDLERAKELIEECQNGKILKI